MKAVTMIFLEIVFLLCAWFVGGKLPEIPSGWFYVLLGLAAYRGGRAVAFNAVFEWLRSMLGCRVVRDTSGAGENNEPCEETGIMQALGELVTCPICSGTWFGMALLVINSFSPEMGKGLIVVLAAAGVAELLHWVSEFFSWGGRNSRVQSGKKR